jgi:hypothetical protein
MRNSRYGWKEQDLERLYGSFGFRIKEGSRHRKYWHPRHPELYAFVPRHRSAKAVYVAYAIRLISRLKEMESQK